MITVLEIVMMKLISIVFVIMVIGVVIHRIYNWEITMKVDSWGDPSSSECFIYGCIEIAISLGLILIGLVLCVRVWLC